MGGKEFKMINDTFDYMQNGSECYLEIHQRTCDSVTDFLETNGNLNCFGHLAAEVTCVSNTNIEIEIPEDFFKEQRESNSIATYANGPCVLRNLSEIEITIMGYDNGKESNSIAISAEVPCESNLIVAPESERSESEYFDARRSKCSELQQTKR